jgi:copper(I)-binding protein
MTKTPILAFAAVLLASAATVAAAQEQGALRIDHPWVRPTPNGAPTAAGYLTVTNRGRSPERLLGGTSPLAGAIEPHTMSMNGAVMRMRLAPNGFEIAPGATLTLAPSGDHLMLVGPKRPFKPGDRIPATLRFAHAGAVKVEFVVRSDPPGATMSMPAMKAH